VSWAEAQKDAKRWLDSLNLKRPVRGELLDLRPYSEQLPFEGKYRVMVINALSRLLKKRRIEAVLPE
jgi:hypothetical protein